METSIGATPQPVFILIRPQLPENIGAVIRALGNTGLWRNLRLVNPICGWPHPQSEAVASGIPTECVRVVTSLPEALSDLHRVIALTQRRRGMVYQAVSLEESLAHTHHMLTQGQRVGFVFGPEKTGLTTEEISLCHAAVHLEAHPEFPCYNLAQAVLVVAYGWFSRYHQRTQASPSPAPPPAPHDALKGLFDHFEDLTQRFSMPSAARPGMLRHLRHLFLRRRLYTHEVNSLRGVLKAFEKTLERKN